MKEQLLSTQEYNENEISFRTCPGAIESFFINPEILNERELSLELSPFYLMAQIDKAIKEGSCL